MHRAKTFLFLTLFILTGVAHTQPLDDGLYATIYMGNEQIVFRLLHREAPMTVANFVGLAEGTITNVAFDKGRPFFDGSSFDRVVPGHVIQGGVPNSKKANAAGYSIPNEINKALSHNQPGMVGMANAGPHTNDNIFYITLGDRSYLDGDYTLFGRVICGHPENVAKDTRIDSIRITRVGSWAEAYQVDDAKLQRQISKVKRAVAEMAGNKAEFEAQYIAKTYPKTIKSASGWLYLVVEKGAGKKIEKLTTAKVRFTGTTPQGLAFMSDNQGETTWLDEGAPDGHFFKYIANQTKINPGLDEAILQMRKGARWIVILSPSFAYGNTGYYPKEKPGEKRFHFSPTTTLIYTVEVASK